MRYFNKENPTKFMPSKSAQNFNYLKIVIWKLFFNLYRHFDLKQTHPPASFARIPKSPYQFHPLPKLTQNSSPKNLSQLRDHPESHGKLML